MKPLYIFDLDGTLADCTHRLRHIQKTPKDWAAFHIECVNDSPIRPTLAILHSLDFSGMDCEIWTARNASTRAATKYWLAKLGILVDIGRMRKDGDHRHDDVLKQEWLNQMRRSDRKRLAGVFEDRSRVVEMWRRNGVQCYQVARGDF